MKYDKNAVIDVLKNGGLLSNHLPNYAERKSQIDLACAIYDSYVKGTNLVAEAPTGIGKSISGLVPAILMACDNNVKTVISTSTKALQSQYYDKDLPFLSNIFASIGRNFSYAMMKGRGNYVCMRRFEEYYTDVILQGEVENYAIVSQYNQLKEWVVTTNTGDFEELPYEVNYELKSEICSSSEDCDGKKCKQSCFYKAMKLRAKNSNVILVNTDLLCTDLVLRNTHSASVIPEYHTVIIDEAHELENIFSKYTGFSLSEIAVKRAIAFAIKYLRRLEREFCNTDEKHEEIKIDYEDMDGRSIKLMKVARSFFDNFIFESTSDTVRIDHTDFDSVVNIAGKKLIKALNDFVLQMVSSTKYTDDETMGEMEKSVIAKFNSIVERMFNIMKLFDEEDTEFVYWVSYTKRGIPIIECRPIDISNILNAWLFDRKLTGPEWDSVFTGFRPSFDDNEKSVAMPIKNVVMMSATMTTNKSFGFITSRLGIYDYDSVILPHAFDYGHNALLYVPKGLVEPNISKNSEIFTRQLAQNIVQLAEVTEGKMLCLFTSYKEMERVFNIVRPQIGNKYKMFNQSQYPKAELVKMFSNDINSILFATSSFWTGVDFKGETLSALVIDKIPFPVPTEPLTEARIERIKSEGGNWFNNYYIPMATMDMCQGFGRLIRTVNDTGIIMICDVRIITKPYGLKFRNSFPPTLCTRKIEKVKVFWDICKKKSLKNKGV